MGAFIELSKMEEDLAAGEDASDEEHPQIFVEHFLFEELHYTMKNNNCIIGLYDELSLLLMWATWPFKSGQTDEKTIL